MCKLMKKRMNKLYIATAFAILCGIIAYANKVSSITIYGVFLPRDELLVMSGE